MPESVMAYMQLPQWLARFNRHVTNPIQRMWAGWAPTMGILEHVGRRSGKRYRTPLTVFNASVDGQDAVAVLLTYGPDRDWLKNVTAGTNPRQNHCFGIKQITGTTGYFNLVTEPGKSIYNAANISGTIVNNYNHNVSQIILKYQNVELSSALDNASASLG